MRVVSNTSPVSSLAILDDLDLIERLRSECRFFVSAKLEARLPEGVGEVTSG
jgi:hypothetical protein